MRKRSPVGPSPGATIAQDLIPQHADEGGGGALLQTSARLLLTKSRQVYLPPGRRSACFLNTVAVASGLGVETGRSGADKIPSDKSRPGDAAAGLSL